MPGESNKSRNSKSAATKAGWYATAAGRRQTQREFERAIKNGTLIVNPIGLNVPRTDPKLLADLLARANGPKRRSA